MKTMSAQDYGDQSDAKTISAVSTLVFYFRTLFERAGIAWHDENEDEIRSIVNDILEAAWCAREARLR